MDDHRGQLRVKSCGVARYILKGVVFAALGQKTGRVAAPGLSSKAQCFCQHLVGRYGRGLPI